MKKSVPQYATYRRILAVALVLAALIGLGFSGSASAATTSGQATIYNTVKVTYTSGTGPTRTASASYSVTVNTIPTAPTVSNPSGVTVIAGGAVSYVYIVKSNSNGYDTYTTSALTNAATNVAAAGSPTVSGSVSLWGGIALGSGAGTITVPYGTTSTLTAGVSTVQIGGNQYTVTTITPGSAASTDGSGNLVPEVPTTLTLTPIGASTAITAGSVAAGTQVGEFKASALTVAFTAGSPTTDGTDGTYSTTFSISTTATTVVTMTTTGVTTTVSSPHLTISKTADKSSAKPGDTITYTITVTNTHLTASASSVTVIDQVPAYTTYVASSTRLNGITVAGDGATSPLAAGILVDSNGSRTAGTVATGILPALGVATVTFQVTVN